MQIYRTMQVYRIQFRFIADMANNEYGTKWSVRKCRQWYCSAHKINVPGFFCLHPRAWEWGTQPLCCVPTCLSQYSVATICTRIKLASTSQPTEKCPVMGHAGVIIYKLLCLPCNISSRGWSKREFLAIVIVPSGHSIKLRLLQNKELRADLRAIGSGM